MKNYKFNLQRSPIDPRDFMLESIYPVQVDLPEVWDLRNNMPSIRDQGQEGSCSAQSAAAMKEWEERIDVQFRDYMSPQFIYNNRANKGEEGMSPRDTMQILNKIGIVPEDDYPYGTNAPITPDLITKAVKYQIMGYSQINTLDSLKKALYANGPVYCAFMVYNPEKMEFWKPDSVGQQALGGHAVCICGYLKDSFIVRNSWGESWGDHGYTYYKFSDFGMHLELWTAIDANSNSQGLADKVAMRSCIDKKGFFAKLFAKKINK